MGNTHIILKKKIYNRIRYNGYKLYAVYRIQYIRGNVLLQSYYMEQLGGLMH